MSLNGMERAEDVRGPFDGLALHGEEDLLPRKNGAPQVNAAGCNWAASMPRPAGLVVSYSSRSSDSHSFASLPDRRRTAAWA